MDGSGGGSEAPEGAADFLLWRQGAEESEGAVFGACELGGAGLDVLAGDGADAGAGFGGVNGSAIAEHGFAEPGHVVVGAVEVHVNLAEGVFAGAVELAC